MTHRVVTNLNKSWRFTLESDIEPEARIFGNAQIIANETSLWQKAGNHGLSRPGNPAVAQWRLVDVPHDYALEGEFTPDVDAKVGALRREKSVYARDFTLTANDRGKRIRITFDGVYRNAMVFVNGFFAGHHMSGYTSFSFDITELCELDRINTVAVQVDPTDNELWSYEGAGIYRGVRLVTTDAVHVNHDGIYVRTGDDGDAGAVRVETDVRNMGYVQARVAVRHRVLSADGVEVASSTSEAAMLPEIGAESFLNTLAVTEPRLWSVDEPTLYTLETTVLVDGTAVDQVETMFGFRSIAFDAQTGFFLNGERLALQGVCIHQDHAGVGIAVPPSIQEWRIRQLKEMGCNAVRMSHNPPDPALLDACDRLGMLVMDEVRIPGVSSEHLGQLEDLMRRDRNHASVIMWSIGNEEMLIQSKRVGVEIFRRMRHLANRLDPSRPTTYAMNEDWIDISDLYRTEGAHVDVFGANYRSGQKSENYDLFHEKFPEWPLIGSETFGGAATRGLFTPDKGSSLPVVIGERWNDPDNFPDERFPQTASAYGQTFTPWGYSIEETWKDVVKRPFLAGTFMWTGFDYRGETFPYDWPSVVSRFGILDYCGFPKEIAHYLRAWWRPTDAYTFVLPHWNWEGRDGENVDVWCYSNAAAVELTLNGRSLGRQTVIPNERLEWEVPFEAGELVATGYADDGTVTSNDRRVTASAPARIELLATRNAIAADGEDCAVVLVRVVDKNGNLCPVSDDDIQFAVTGDASIIGLGNGDPNSHEPDKGSRRRVFHGLAEVIIQSGTSQGQCELSATGWRLENASVTIALVDATDGSEHTGVSTFDAVRDLTKGIVA